MKINLLINSVIFYLSEADSLPPLARFPNLAKLSNLFFNLHYPTFCKQNSPQQNAPSETKSVRAR